MHENIRAHAHDSKVILPAFSRAARENGIWILAGTIPLFHEDKNRSGGEKSLYNTCLVFNDQGEIVAQADKLHLLEVHTRKNDYRESEVLLPAMRSFALRARGEISLLRSVLTSAFRKSAACFAKTAFYWRCAPALTSMPAKALGAADPDAGDGKRSVRAGC
ncbi:nitrilase-related carbon-nitrogen hydrolase [Allobaculum sp. Allo2]|uniref:nitrilase-related carbon-nitrogen hydrolase n=1 Tax=Allobaculum sp. Allo2 TaxID=2853432 RepID=UPI003463694C|nr:hypothetical protein KWG61_03995 [Allobaculum sp. Allo2]